MMYWVTIFTEKREEGGGEEISESDATRREIRRE